MHLPSPSTLASWEAVVIVAGLFGLVCWKMITGEISLDCLFEGDGKDDTGNPASYTSAGRVQAFGATLYIALYYIVQFAHDPKEFPAIPNWMVVTLAGSHAIYLGGKAQDMLQGRLRDFLK
ncbi:MAG TPA: hypothetical protein VNW97_16460 [Candidatus Saccharimonadales bacterium]|nr:hypothetical protein [Candidatus Saccharimonadales bacterium]